MNLERVCNEVKLDLGEYPIPWMTVFDCLKITPNKMTALENAFLLIKWIFLLENQVNYVQYIIVSRYIEKTGVGIK